MSRSSLPLHVFVFMRCVIYSDASLHPCTKEHHFVQGCHELKIVSGNSNKPLADRVAQCLGTEVAQCSVGRFNDGEISVQMKESVRGKDVYVVCELIIFLIFSFNLFALPPMTTFLNLSS